MDELVSKKEKYHEVRLRIFKDKDKDLYEKMNMFPEVNWSAVSRKAILNYIIERERRNE